MLINFLSIAIYMTITPSNFFYCEFLDEEVLWLASRAKDQYVYYLYDTTQQKVISKYTSKLKSRLVVSGSHRDLILHTDGLIVQGVHQVTLPRISDDTNITERLFVYGTLVYDRISTKVIDETVCAYNILTYSCNEGKLYKQSELLVTDSWPYNTKIVNVDKEFHVSFESHIDMFNLSLREYYDIRLTSVASFSELDRVMVQGKFLAGNIHGGKLYVVYLYNNALRMTCLLIKQGNLIVEKDQILLVKAPQGQIDLKTTNIVCIDQKDTSLFDIVCRSYEDFSAIDIKAECVSDLIPILNESCSTLAFIKDFQLEISKKNGNEFKNAYSVYLPDIDSGNSEVIRGNSRTTN